MASISKLRRILIKLSLNSSGIWPKDTKGKLSVSPLGAHHVHHQKEMFCLLTERVVVDLSPLGMNNSPDLGRETAVISKLLTALSQSVLKPLFPLIWRPWLLKQLLSLLPVLLESSAALLRNRGKKNPKSNFILRSSEIAVVDGSYFCYKNVFITFLPSEGTAMWPILLPEMPVQHSWWAEPVYHCQQVHISEHRWNSVFVPHFIADLSLLWFHIPEEARWEGGFAIRAALHGLAINTNSALNPAICGSCYSYSGSNLSIVQAHQTQQRYNRVDLA